ncbi:MAG: KOW motif-containing protein, partial [Pseudomonadota bacterium]
MAAKLRKGDKVVVLVGKDKGKEGTIEQRLAVLRHDLFDG